MNMVLAVGFLAVFGLLLCVLCAIADEWERIPLIIRGIRKAFCEWLFNVVTAYYKWKNRRKRNAK